MNDLNVNILSSDVCLFIRKINILFFVASVACRLFTLKYDCDILFIFHSANAVWNILC